MDQFGLKIDEDGTTEWVTWQGTDSLSTLQRGVGDGPVDVVALTDDVDMWINDEGLFRYGINLAATRLARLHGKTHQPYFGPVVITGQREGATLGLTRAAQAWLNAWVTGHDEDAGHLSNSADVEGG